MLIQTSSKMMRRIGKAVQLVEGMQLEGRRRRRRMPYGGEGTIQTQPVWIKKVSGVAGDAEAPCTFAYDGWRLDADTSDDAQRLFIEEEPMVPRTIVGKYDESPEDCPAWAIFIQLDGDDESTWHLWHAPGERWNVPGPCNPCNP